MNETSRVPWGPWDPPALTPIGFATAAKTSALQPAATIPDDAPTPLRLAKPTFVSSEPWQEQRMGAVAVSCSDGRYGDAVDELCHKCLKIPAYDRLAVPGGPGWINDADVQRIGLCRTIRDQLDFLVRSHGIERIVLITHYGCGFYARRLRASANACVARQLDDIRAAEQILHKWFGPIATEGYLAMPRQGTLSFYRVN